MMMKDACWNRGYVYYKYADVDEYNQHNILNSHVFEFVELMVVDIVTQIMNLDTREYDTIVTPTIFTKWRTRGSLKGTKFECTHNENIAYYTGFDPTDMQNYLNKSTRRGTLTSDCHFSSVISVRRFFDNVNASQLIYGIFLVVAGLSALILITIFIEWMCDKIGECCERRRKARENDVESINKNNINSDVYISSESICDEDRSGYY